MARKRKNSRNRKMCFIIICVLLSIVVAKWFWLNYIFFACAIVCLTMCETRHFRSKYQLHFILYTIRIICLFILVWRSVTCYYKQSFVSGGDKNRNRCFHNNFIFTWKFATIRLNAFIGHRVNWVSPLRCISACWYFHFPQEFVILRFFSLHFRAQDINMFDYW